MTTGLNLIFKYLSSLQYIDTFIVCYYLLRADLYKKKSIIFNFIALT